MQSYITHDDRRDGSEDYYQLVYSTNLVIYISFYEDIDDALEAGITALRGMKMHKVGLINLEHYYQGETDTLINL